MISVKLVSICLLFWQAFVSLTNQIIAASEARSDTIFDDSRTTRAPADGKDPVPADIIGSQTKILWAG